MSDSVRLAAHAKMNAFLRVLARETGGYHTIETLFVLLELADEVVVERTGGGIALEVTGADTGPAEQNLAWRAADLLLQAVRRRFGVRIHLTKHIPLRAGLGGGSSDAAAVLAAVNALADHAVPRHEILQLAARLGSDVPFFASGAALALGWGRGERLLRLPAPAAAPALIAVPPFGISTPDAYSALDRARQQDSPRGALALDQEALSTWGSIGRLGGNDFEGVLFPAAPRLREVFERMAGTGPLLVRVSGSGSAVVALYRGAADRDAAAEAMGTGRQALIRTATRNAPAPSPQPTS